MILGERIKRIRTFRRLTQRELGLKLGYEERNADVRVAQYESGCSQKRYSHGNCQDFECQLYKFYYRSPRLRRGHYANFFLA